MAKRAQKILVALGTVGVGLGAAALFRKPPQPPAPVAAESSARFALQPPAEAPREEPAEISPLPSPPVAAESRPAWALGLAENLDKPQTTGIAEQPAVTAPPPFPIQATGTAEGSFPGIAVDQPPPSLSATFGSPTDPEDDGAAPDASSPGVAERQHRVADGDTLAEIAQRYFGDPGRHLEIFNANRDVLESPDLLPIGVTLRIPPPQQFRVRPADEDRLVPVTRPAQT